MDGPVCVEHHERYFKGDLESREGNNEAKQYADMQIELQAAEEWAAETVSELERLWDERKTLQSDCEAMRDEIAAQKSKNEELTHAVGQSKKESKKKMDDLEERLKKQEAELENAKKAVEEAKQNEKKAVEETRKSRDSDHKAREEALVAQRKELEEALQKEQAARQDDAKASKTEWEKLKKKNDRLQQHRNSEHSVDLNAKLDAQRKQLEAKHAEEMQRAKEAHEAEIQEVLQKAQDKPASPKKDDREKKFKERERALNLELERVQATLNNQISKLKEDTRELKEDKRKAEKLIEQTNTKLSDSQRDSEKLKEKLAIFENEQWTRNSQEAAIFEETEKELKKKIQTETTGKITTLERQLKDSEAELATLRMRLNTAEKELKGGKKKLKANNKVQEKATKTLVGAQRDVDFDMDTRKLQLDRYIMNTKIFFKNNWCIIAFSILCLIVAHMLTFPNFWNYSTAPSTRARKGSFDYGRQ